VKTTPPALGRQRPAEAGGDHAREQARLVEDPAGDREPSGRVGRRLPNRHRHPAVLTRKAGEPHPYVIGNDAVKRFLTVSAECATASLVEK
jgi:hypothetical protein